VAILDTGVEKTHSAFGNRVKGEACYSGGGDSSQSFCPGGALAVKGPGTAGPCDLSLDDGACTHGTHVAGIAAGSTGVAKEATIVAIQVFSNISGEVQAYTSDIIAGLERAYALRSTFDMASVNLSLGGGGYTATCDSVSPATTAAMNTLVAGRIAPVVASGNDSYTNAISWPGCISSVVSVGSTTKADVVSSFSNSANFLKLLAPGSNITAPVPGNSLGTKSGTSMATPHVTGAWALLEDKTPALKVAAGLAALQSTGVSIVDSRNGLTFKRIRIMNALNTLTALPAATLTAPTGTGVPVTPTFRWNKVAASTRYLVRVEKVSGGAVAINTTYLSADVCTGSLCALSSPVTLASNTQYRFWVQTFEWGSGPWSTPLTFTTGTPLGTPTLHVPSGTINKLEPMYEWTKVTGATNYQLVLVPVSGGTPLIDKVYSSSLCDSTVCKVTPSRTLTPGTEYRWRVRARTGANIGLYSPYKHFTPSALLPGKTTLVSPTMALDHDMPNYKWSKVASASRYYLTVMRGSTVFLTRILVASDVCGTSLCHFAPGIAHGTGSFKWRVQTKNGTGFGPYSSWASFSTTSTESVDLTPLLSLPPLK
jgi:hypothetical protein